MTLTREEHMGMLETALRLLKNYLPEAVPLVKADGSLDPFDADAWANELVQGMETTRWQAFRDRLRTTIERAHQHGRLLEGELLRRGMTPATYVGLPAFNGYKSVIPWWPDFHPVSKVESDMQALLAKAPKPFVPAVPAANCCTDVPDLADLTCEDTEGGPTV